MAVYNHYKRIYHASRKKGFVLHALIILIHYMGHNKASSFYSFLNSRSASESDNLDMEDDNIDHVELDKSNVLLLGPTGSGAYFIACHNFLESI